MKNFKTKLFFLVSFIILLPAGVLAETQSTLLTGLLDKAGQKAGYQIGGSQQLSMMIGRIIFGALGLLGVIFLVLIVFAGYLWLTAGGEEEKVKKAQGYIKNGVIGLIIVLAAFGISAFVLSSLINASA